MAEDDVDDLRKGIQSVENAMTVLLTLEEGQGPMTLTQISAATAMSPSKAHRYLVSLGRVGLISRAKGSGLYDMGPSMRRLGAESLRRMDEAGLASEYLPGLRDRTGHAVSEGPQDPNQLHPRPDFPQQDQTHPGWTGPMDPPPDHGERSYHGSGLLADRKTVITGGDSGIGRAVALAFAREGADVMFTHLPEEEEDAQETVRLVEEAGRRAVPTPCDIRNEQQCRSLVERAVSEFGRIDVLVNNAAYQMSQPDGISAISTEQFDRVVRTNLYGMFWLCQASLPHIPKGGSIINTTSVQAYKPSPHLLDYAMTKGAIVTFTQGLAQMLAPEGIRVNAVAPGPVWTPLIPATLPDTAEFGKQSPLGRPAQPAEMAPAYVFLASANASFITGEIMNATGGTPLP